MKSLRYALILALLLCLPTFAGAQLTFTLAPPNPIGWPGQTLTFSGILTNTSPDPVFLNGTNFTLDSPDLTLDDSPFLEVPASLDGNASFSGTLFTISIDPAAIRQQATGIFTILGGSTVTDNNALASQTFTVQVSAPEPTAGALLTSVAVVALFALRRNAARNDQ